MLAFAALMSRQAVSLMSLDVAVACLQAQSCSRGLAACGIAPTLLLLVIGRVLQGAAGALMVPRHGIISNAYDGSSARLLLGH